MEKIVDKILYLNMKLFYSSPSNKMIHIKNSIEFNTFIEKSSFVTISNKNEIKAYKNQADLTDKILFSVKIDKNKIILTKILVNNLELTIDNINRIDDLIFRVINSDDYIHLKEKDIINFGGLTYIVQKININKADNSNNKKKVDNKEDKDYKENENNEGNRSILKFYPNDIKSKSCDICSKKLVKLCNCETYEHLDFINQSINNKNNLIPKENDKKTVKSYQFKLYRCNICHLICPLKFKYDKNEKLDDKEKRDYEFINIEKSNCDYDDYVILEFLGKVNNENVNLVDKYIYVINLTGEEIIIGRGKDGKLIIDDDKNLDEAFCVLKFDKNEKKLYIKNKNDNYYTYIAVKDKLEITEKEIFIKADRALVKAKLMKKEDLNKIENGKLINPLHIIETDELKII